MNEQNIVAVENPAFRFPVRFPSLREFAAVFGLLVLCLWALGAETAMEALAILCRETSINEMEISTLRIAVFTFACVKFFPGAFLGRIASVLTVKTFPRAEARIISGIQGAPQR